LQHYHIKKKGQVTALFFFLMNSPRPLNIPNGRCCAMVLKNPCTHDIMVRSLMQSLYRRPMSSQVGFTLLELLVVLVIIGLLSGLVAPKLFSRLDASKVQTAEAQVKMLRGTVGMVRLDLGRLPTPKEGLGLLSTPPAPPREAAHWRGPYLEDDLPLDPWGNPYQYAIPGAGGQPFALYSLGADGKLGGDGDNADIGILANR
jgi:general secretion pathway protein G